MSNTTDNTGDLQEFAAFLLAQSNGRTHDELSDGLHDLVARVKDTGKKGSISLTVTVAPWKEDITVMVVTDEIKLKLPEHDRKASMFWPDDDNNLLRNDPNQMSLWGQEAPREVPPPGVDPITGEATSTYDQQGN